MRSPLETAPHPPSPGPPGGASALLWTALAATLVATPLLMTSGVAAPRQPDAIEIARRLLGEDRFGEAIPLLERARLADPGDPDALWMLAVAHLRLGRHEETAELAAAFAALVPDEPNGLLLRATALTALGRIEEAEGSFREALARDPGHPEARRELATLLTRRGEREEAQAILQALHAEYPGRAEVLVPLGVLYVQQGRGAAGLAALQQAAQREPSSFEAQYHLGALWSELGQFEPAERRLEAALALRPEDPAALLEICLLQSREDRLEAARDACERAAAAAPENPEAQFRLGDVLHYLQEEEAAERAYREALRLDPGHVSAHLRLGLLLHETGRSTEAVPVLTPAVDGPAAATDPEQLASGFTTLGQALAAAADPEAAILRFEAAIRAAPTRPEPHLHLGNLLARSEDPEEAERGREYLTRFSELKRFSDRTNELKVAMGANPAAPEPKRALVAHLIQGGAAQLALRESDRLLTLAAAEPLHHLLYAESLAALSRPQEAQSILEAALADWPENTELRSAAARLAREP